MVKDREEKELYEILLISPICRLFEKEGVQILVDEITMDFINGSIIDYKTEMIRQSFEVALNPNAEIGCSCGSSFAPKEK